MRKYDKVYPGTGGTWQGIINKRRWAEIEKRGLQPGTPFTVSDRFDLLGNAAWYRRYRLALFSDRLLNGERVQGNNRYEWLRMYALALESAQKCDKPRLP